MPTPDHASWLHFVGVGGSGMSALAQYHTGRGGRATGSDRAFDQDERAEIRRQLEQAGVEIVPQDGAALTGDCQAVILSTAVEDSIPDVIRARELNVPLKHRSELLEIYVAQHQTVAVTGTSGKSTVTAMIWTILRGCGKDPGLLTGGPAIALQDEGLLGNACSGSEPGFLVVEADESDGSVVRYHPWAGVVLNLGRDHKEPAEIAAMFSAFRLNCAGPLIIGDGPDLRFLRPGATTCGLSADAQVRGTDVELGPRGVAFTVDGVRYTVPQPGRHTVLNALASIAACHEAGCAPAAMAAPLAGFRGVARRFVSLGAARGVEVIDDFAHNPDKLAAALAAGRDRLAGTGGRVLAVFQPHGYGPTRFLRDDLIAALSASLRPEDVLWLPEIFYAGGTVNRDISSADLVAGIVGRGREARFLADRAGLPAAIAAEARDGDLVMVMGARDPSLTELARGVLGALGER
ncbi:MAG: Mur ligase domain-containing protein [Candidatus Krumholzibacteriia bacterium]